MRPNPHCDEPKLCSRHTTHLRRRTQRAEEEVTRLQMRLSALKAEIDAERNRLTAYLDSPQHHYDRLLDAQTQLGLAVRDMAKHHRTCSSCGGFSRKALDDVLEPTLVRLRDELGLQPPPALAERAGDWPGRRGQAHYQSRFLETYRTPAEKEAHRKQTLY